MNLLLHNKSYHRIILMVMFFGFLNSILIAGLPKTKKSNQNITSKSSSAFATVKGNNVTIAMSNSGSLIDYHVRGDSGMTLAKTKPLSDMGVQTVFQSSIWVSAINSRTDSLVGVFGDYTDDMHPGEWESDPGDYTDPKYKIYTVDIDMLNAPEYYSDFQNWPTDQGAPFVDVDGNGIYNPLPTGTDYPKFYGDTVSWWVSADSNPVYKANVGTPPTNIEFQTMAYSFNRPLTAPKYDNVVFYKVLMINKGDDTLKEVLTGIWSDPDLGYASNDFVGIDVARSMAFAYNDGADDQQEAYYNAPEQSVALGIDLLQGPMMDCSSDGYIDIILTGTDLDNDPVEISIVDNPKFGSIEYITNSQQTNGSQTQTTWRYTPNQNYIGPDSFTYVANDENSSSNLGSVNISVVDASGEKLPAVVYPNGGEYLVPGRTYNLLWRRGSLTSSDEIGPVSFEKTNIGLFKGGSQIDILASGELTSSYTWTIPTNITSGTDYQIRLRNMTGGEISYTDLSDQYFTIAPVTLTYPNGGEVLMKGSTYDITWDGDFLVDTGIQIYKGNTKIAELAGGTGKVNSWSWTIADTLANGVDYKIRIYDAGVGEEEDYSDSFFTISTSSSSELKSNQVPTVTNQSLNARVNESCTNAQMFGEIYPNKKNLPLSSFSFYLNGDATFTDPDDEEEFRNYMKGLSKDGSSYPYDISGLLYDQKFPLYGDPTSAAGHSTNNPIDGNYATAADRRMSMNTGPFIMAPNDSQEVVFAFIHDFGTNPIDALDSLKVTDSQLQSDYDNQFSIFNVSDSASISLQASASSGYAPLSVSFDGSDTSPLEILSWDFDNDGEIDSKSFTPTYVFDTPGEYAVQVSMQFKDFINGLSTYSTLTDSLVINVLSPNPIVENKSYSINEDTETIISLSGNDPQNLDLSFEIEKAPSNGVFNLSENLLTYKPNQNFVGQDSLKYSASNANYKSNIGTININVVAVDDDPTTFDVVATTNEDSSININLSADEYDGDDYSFTIKTNPSNGQLSEVDGTSVTYSPNANWFGVDTFTYEASDDKFAKINIATVAITVNPVNDLPETYDMVINSYEDQVTTITLDVYDVDGDTLTVINTSPSNGVISSKLGNLFSYTPNEDYNGSDSFTYYVNDGELDSNTSNVTINLTPVNDASSEFEVSEDYKVNTPQGDRWTILTNNLIATPKNQQDSLEFKWEESFDIDGDIIKYRMIGFDALEFLTMENWTTDLKLLWSIKDLVSNTDTVNVANGSWMIIATDGEFFTESNDGNPVELSINGSALIPDNYVLNQNYPNPFSSSTTISYDMPETQKVMIRIFDVRGRLIRTLTNEEQNAGFKSVVWDGKNDDGKTVSAGIYFYQMYAPSSLDFNGLTSTKKMIKLN